MGKTVKSVLDPGDFIFRQKEEQARKDAKEQAALDRQALETKPTSAPTMDSEAVSAAREAERKRRAAASGQSSTILTGPSGLAGGGSGGKTLLGQ